MSALRFGLSFNELSIRNAERCTDSFHPIGDWSPTDWACALAGEAGEACNLIKKLRRGEAVSVEEIGKELADVVIYADLLATRLDLDLGRTVASKFNEVSERVGSPIRLIP